MFVGDLPLRHKYHHAQSTFFVLILKPLLELHTIGGAGRGHLAGDGGGGAETERAICRPNAETGAIKLGQIYHQGQCVEYII